MTIPHRPYDSGRHDDVAAAIPADADWRRLEAAVLAVGDHDGPPVGLDELVDLLE